MANLFPYNRKRQLASKASEIVTPFGALSFTWRINTQIHQYQTAQIYQISNQGRIWVWQEQKLQLELLIDQLPAKLYDPQPIESAWMAIWRLQTQDPLPYLRFDCNWQTPYTWQECQTDTGQGLFAQTWHDQTYRLSVGTEDPEGVAFRAYRNSDSNSPELFSYDLMHENKYHQIDYSDSHISIQPQNIHQQQIYQFHYLVAWSQDQNDPQLQVIDWASDQLVSAYEQYSL